MILRPDEEGGYGQRDYNCPVDPKIFRHNPIVCFARKLEKSRRKKTLGRKMLAKEYSKNDDLYQMALTDTYVPGRYMRVIAEMVLIMSVFR
jgi:hypothetical protein